MKCRALDIMGSKIPATTPTSPRGEKRMGGSTPEGPSTKHSFLNTTGSITPPQAWFDETGDADPNLPQIQRPKFTLPPFKREVLQYKTFMHNFQQFIHCNQKLTFLDKINYLQTAVDFSFRKTLQKFPLSIEGYKQRLKYLQERYSHEGRIQQQIWKSISAIKPKDNTTAAMREAYEWLMLSLKYAEGHHVLINPQDLFTIVCKNFPQYLYKHRVTADDSVQHLLDVIRQTIKFREYYGSYTPNNIPTKKGTKFQRKFSPYHQKRQPAFFTTNKKKENKEGQKTKT